MNVSYFLSLLIYILVSTLTVSKSDTIEDAYPIVVEEETNVERNKNSGNDKAEGSNKDVVKTEFPENIFENPDLNFGEMVSDDLLTFLPGRQNQIIVNNSPCSSSAFSSQWTSQYIVSDIEQTAISNLALRTHFLNDKRRFEALNEKIEKLEMELAATNLKIDEAHDDAKERITNVKDNMNDNFEDVQLKIRDLNNNIDIIKKTVDLNQSTNEKNLKSLGGKATDLSASSEKIMGSFKAMGDVVKNVENIKPPKCLNINENSKEIENSKEKDNSEEKKNSEEKEP